MLSQREAAKNGMLAKSNVSSLCRSIRDLACFSSSNTSGSQTIQAGQSVTPSNSNSNFNSNVEFDLKFDAAASDSNSNVNLSLRQPHQAKTQIQIEISMGGMGRTRARRWKGYFASERGGSTSSSAPSTREYRLVRSCSTYLDMT